MNKEELLARIADLEAAGIFTKEEADEKRAQIEAKFNTEKTEVEPTEEPAQEIAKAEPEIEEPKGMEKINELIYGINTAEGDTWLEKAFNVLVPSEGAADTVAGELVRALMRIMYRYYNDGDYFYKDYGLETCGGCAEFLLDTDDLLSEVVLEITENGYTSSTYEESLDTLAEKLEMIVMNTDLEDPADSVLLQDNEADCMHYSTRTIEEYAPTYDVTASLPDSIIAHMDKGHVSSYDVEDFVNDEFSYYFGPNTEVNCYRDYVEISYMTSDELSEDEVYESLRRWADDLYDEYGDPYFDYESFIQENSNLREYALERGAGIKNLQDFDSDLIKNATDAIYEIVYSGIMNDHLYDSYDTESEEGTIEYLMAIGGLLSDMFEAAEKGDPEDSNSLKEIANEANIDEKGMEALRQIFLGITDNAGEETVLESKEASDTCDLSVEIPEDEAHTLREDYYCVSDGMNPKNSQLFIDSPEGEKAALELAKASKMYKYVSKFVNGDEQIIWRRSDEEENAKDVELEEAKKDLTTVKGTYSKLLNDNIEKIYAEGEDDSVSLQDYKTTILDIVKSANNTPAKATFEYKVSQMRSKQELMFYASNAALNGGGFGVNPWKSEIKESCEGCTVEYEAGRYDDEGQVIDSEAVIFIDKDEAIMFAEENGYDYVTGYTYDDGDTLPKSSFEVWTKEHGECDDCE